MLGACCACGGGGGGGDSGNQPPPASQPVQEACTLIGGFGGERAQGVWVLHNGDVLVAGETTSDFTLLPEFPQPATPFYDMTLNTSGGNPDAYVAVLDPTLTQVKSWTYLGGDGEERAYFAMEDGAAQGHNIWVVGITAQTSPQAGGCGCTGAGCEAFPVVPADRCYKSTAACAGCGNSECWDVFLAKLSPDLRTLESSLVIGGSRHENSRPSMTIDPSDGSVFVSGATSSPDFFRRHWENALAGTVACNNGTAVLDAFLFKVDNDGQLQWSGRFGGSGNDNAWANVRVDPATDSVYVAGGTTSPDLLNGLAVTPFQAALDGISDGFVAKFASSSGQFRNASYFGGAGFDSFAFNDCMELDAAGRPVVVGITRSGSLPATSADSLSETHSNGADPVEEPASSDVFVAVFDPSLAGVVYSSYVNGPGNGQATANESEEPAGVALDAAGRIYITGETRSVDFPVTHDALDGEISLAVAANLDDATVHDGFVVVLDPGIGVPSRLDYASFFGGDDLVTGAAEAGTRCRSATLLGDPSPFAGALLYSGQTTTPDFARFTSDGAVFPLWLPSDLRDGFVAILRVP